MFTLKIQLHTTSSILLQRQSTPPGDFFKYIQTLKLLKQQLLNNVKSNENIFQTVESFKANNANLHMTSDGSAPDFIGTFGWAAKTNHELSLATNNGPAPGYRTTSYRSEAYGLISFLLFLYHSMKYTSITPIERIKLHSDSQSLVNTSNKLLKCPHYYSTATLIPDWSVLQAMVNILNTLPSIPELSHVSGHQDAKKAYN